MSNFLKNIHPLLKRGRDKYDDTNFAVLNALKYELTEMERETIESKIQSSLKTATGEYLDKWGDWFGVYRKEGESDEKYRARIIKYLLLKRGTIPAIIDAIKDFLEDNDANIIIYEPWKNIFYTNKSKLNGEDHLMGHYYRFAIIDISIDRPFPPEIMDVIQAFKPAGVMFYVNYDGSLNPLSTYWTYPVADIKVGSKVEYDYLTGTIDTLRGRLTMADKDNTNEDTDLFRTNNSHLNGKDVLAGSFTHNRGFTNLASSTEYTSYIPKENDALSDVKLATEELDGSFYLLTKDEDKQVAQANIVGVGNENILKGSNDISIYSNNTGTAPIQTTRMSEGNREFIRVNPATTSSSGIISTYNSLFYKDMTEDIAGKKVTVSFYYRKSSNIDGLKVNLFATTFNPNTTNENHAKSINLSTDWERASTTFIIPDNISNTGGIRMSLVYNYRVPTGGYIDMCEWKIELGEIFPPTIWSPSSEDFLDNRLATYQYYTYDLAKYVELNFKKEYTSLVNKGLSPKEAYAELVKNPTITTVMKSLVSPTNKVSYTLEVFDFMSNSWHTVYTGDMDNNWDKQNINIQSIVDYLNAGYFIFTRIGFEKKAKTYTVNLDVVNLDFSNRYGEGYTITQKMEVSSNTNAGSLSDVKHNFYSTAITGKYTGNINMGKLYIDNKYISQGGDFKDGSFNYYVKSDLVKRDSIVTLEGWDKKENLMLDKSQVTLVNNTTNFLTNSSYKYSSSFWVGAGLVTSTEDDPYSTDTRIMNISRTGATANRAFVTQPLRNIPSKGVPITFSGYYLVDSTIQMDATSSLFMRISNNGTFIGDVLAVDIPTTTTTDKWNYFEVTTTIIPEYTNITCCIALGLNGKLKVKQFKLEQGVNAYPWTPTNSIVLKSDFNSPPKVSNSMVENKHDFRYGLSGATSLQPPTAVWGEGEQVHMDGIKSLDGTTANLTRYGENVIGQWLIKYNIIWMIESNMPTIFSGAKNLADKIAIAKNVISGNKWYVWVKGSDTTGNNVVVKTLNYASNWVDLTAGTNTTDTIKAIGTSFYDARRIQDDGYMYILVHSGASDGKIGSNIQVDYTNMEITLATPC